MSRTFAILLGAGTKPGPMSNLDGGSSDNYLLRGPRRRDPSYLETSVR
jgi:hypothetical protein